MIFTELKQLNYEQILEHFPDLATLQYVIENNICHSRESALAHTMRVFLSCKQILNSLPVESKDYVGKQFIVNKREDLILLASLFHDIGKPETLVFSKGITSCPGHEAKSADRFVEIFRDKIIKEELMYIKKIIENHCLIQSILDDPKSFEKNFLLLKSKHSDLVLEYLIIGLADIYGCHQNLLNRSFHYRISLLSEKIGLDKL